MQSWLNGGKRSHDLKRRENWEFHSGSSDIMADLVQSDYEGKGVGLTPMNLCKTTIARFFRVHEDGLHLKIVKKRQVRKCMAAIERQVFIVNGNKKCTCGCLSC